MTSPTFSVCIPNYNYANYVVETIESVLRQDAALEVVVSDNASTDASASVIGAIGDDRVKLHVNRANIGFAGNLDRAVSLASGEWVLLVSSDDLVEPGALATYDRVIKALGARAQRSVIASGTFIIDGDGKRIGQGGPAPWAWSDAGESAELSQAAGSRVLEHAAPRLLHHALLRMRTPFYFASLAYPLELWRAIEGYRATKFINPDKGFSWRVLGVADHAYFVDQPLFAYRVHNRNQLAQQSASGALKHLLDQYSYTFELDDALLQRASVERSRLAEAFVDEDIALRGLDALASGNRLEAVRICRFGQATFPALMRRNPKAIALRLLLAAGPVGTTVTSAVKRRRQVQDRQIVWHDN